MSPQSVLGKALHYADKPWDKLTVYVAYGRLRMDNNLTEDASANFYGVIETAKANNLEPYASYQAYSIIRPSSGKVSSSSSTISPVRTLNSGCRPAGPP